VGGSARSDTAGGAILCYGIELLILLWACRDVGRAVTHDLLGLFSGPLRRASSFPQVRALEGMTTGRLGTAHGTWRAQASALSSLGMSAEQPGQEDRRKYPVRLLDLACPLVGRPCRHPPSSEIFGGEGPGGSLFTLEGGRERDKDRREKERQDGMELRGRARAAVVACVVRPRCLRRSKRRGAPRARHPWRG
jgi:hypothetical protein